MLCYIRLHSPICFFPMLRSAREMVRVFAAMCSVVKNMVYGFPTSMALGTSVL